MTPGKTQLTAHSTTAPGKAEGHVPLNLGRAFRRNRWRIVVGVVVGLGLGVLYGVLTGPWYESTAEVWVFKKRLDTAPMSGPNSEARPDDYLSTHMLLLTSPRVVERAVKKEKLETLPCFSRDGVADRAKASLARLILGPGRPVTEQERVRDEIIDSLLVTRDAQRPGVTPSNEVMNIAFRGKVAEDCGKVLRAVIASYQSFLKDTQRDVNAETLETIERARDELKKDLDAQQAAYEAFRKKTPLVWKGKEGATLDQERIFQIDLRLSALRARQVEREGTLKKIDAAVKDGGEAEVMRLIAGLPSDSPEAKAAARAKLQERLQELREEEERLQEKYGSNYLPLKMVRKSIKNVRGQLDPPQDRGGQGLSPATRELVRIKLEQLNQERDQDKRAEESLDQLLKDEKAAAKAAILHTSDDEWHRKRIERSQILFDNIVKSIWELKGAREFAGFYTEKLAEPEPGRWALKKVLLVSGLSLFLGLLLGLGWAYRTELTDRSFRKPDEIRQALGWPVLAHVPLLGEAGQEAGAEAFRAVRAALYLAPSADSQRVIQVTGPDRGCGKTTLTAHLAAAIAQSGKRVLVVDADLRRPCQHKIYGLGNDAGLTAVLAGRAAPQEAIQETPVPGLSVLPSGPRAPDPAGLLSSPRLKELLGSLRERYDYVLVDSPPLLAVTDPRVVAHHVDGVLLVLRLGRRSRPDAQVAKEALGAAGAGVLGVVVNGVPRRSGPDSPDYEWYPLGSAYTPAST
jgi:polysaccharide biosynthesis transport protein